MTAKIFKSSPSAFFDVSSTSFCASEKSIISGRFPEARNQPCSSNFSNNLAQHHILLDT